MAAEDRATQQHDSTLGSFAAPPPFDGHAPTEDRVTDYDAAHFIDYARMLDAERAGHDWRAAAVAILRQDPDRDEASVRRCWDSHIARAHWIATAGYGQVLASAGIDPADTAA